MLPAVHVFKEVLPCNAHNIVVVFFSQMGIVAAKGIKHALQRRSEVRVLLLTA